MALNLSQLNDGSNIAEWIMILNSWTDGLMFSAFLIIIAIIIFTISQNNAGTKNAFLGTSFIMFLISAVAWFIQNDTYKLVSDFIPMLFLMFVAVGVLITVLGDRILQN